MKMHHAGWGRRTVPCSFPERTSTGPALRADPPPAVWLPYGAFVWAEHGAVTGAIKTYTYARQY